MNTKKKFLTAALSALLISLPAAAFAADAEPEMKYDHGVVSIENNAQPEGGNVLIGAQYDDEGRMVKVRLYDVTGKERVSVGSDFAPNSSVKFMLWDDLSEMESAAKAEETRTEPTPSVLKDGESYGWVISVYDNEAGKTVVKLMTANGAKDYVIADDISVWLPGNAGTGLQNYEGNSKGEPVSIETAADAIKEINNYETETDASGKATVINPTDYLVSLDYRGSGYEIRLVKYAANDNGELSKLYYAVDAAEIEDNDALRVDINNLSGLPPVCGTVQGYLISDGITEFNVPNNYEAMSDPYNYSVGSVDSSNYVISETGSVRNYLVGGFINAAQPTFVINFMNINDDPAQFTEMDSAGAGPDMMIADNTKALGLDRQGNPVYKINGYLNNAKASVETNKNTSIGQMTTSFWSQMNNGRNFDAQTVWTTADNGGDNPDTIISKGDTLLYMPSGRVIAKYIDASALYDYVVNGTEMDPNPIGEHNNNSSARVGFWFGAVSENGRTAESTWIKLDDISETFFVPDDKVINLVEIDKNTGEISIVSDGMRSDKLLPFDKETNTGDYMYISSANKGGLKDVTVYRFTDGTRQPENLENPKPLSKLGEGESYGWVISVYDSDDGENTMIKLMTADGAVDYPVSESADIWLPGQSEPGYTGGIGAALKSVEYTKVMNSIYDSSGTEVRLVKYGTNSSGEISKLYYAINSSLTDDENAVTVHTINLRGTPARMGAVGGYMVTDGIIEFNVPNDTAHMEDTANYSVKQVKASEYVVPENGTRHWLSISLRAQPTPHLLPKWTARARDLLRWL